jgi:hypothetical protein
MREGTQIAIRGSSQRGHAVAPKCYDAKGRLVFKIRANFKIAKAYTAAFVWAIKATLRLAVSLALTCPILTP